MCLALASGSAENQPLICKLREHGGSGVLLEFESGCLEREATLHTMLCCQWDSQRTQSTVQVERILRTSDEDPGELASGRIVSQTTEDYQQDGKSACGVMERILKATKIPWIQRKAAQTNKIAKAAPVEKSSGGELRSHLPRR